MQCFSLPNILEVIAIQRMKVMMEDDIEVIIQVMKAIEGVAEETEAEAEAETEAEAEVGVEAEIRNVIKIDIMMIKMITMIMMIKMITMIMMIVIMIETEVITNVSDVKKFQTTPLWSGDLVSIYVKLMYVYKFINFNR